MRALVTGATGFVGRHLLAALAEAGHESFACGGPHDTQAMPLDLADASALRAALDLAQPDVVFHLAAQTFVPEAIADPAATFATNVDGTANLLRALQAYAQDEAASPRLVFASSAEVYGQQPASAFPLKETTPLAPRNPYAESKAAAERLLLDESRRGALDLVVVRSFNLIGPGQSDRFVVPNFAKQLAQIANGGKPVMYVGNLETKRDFLDVRDAARAYVALAERGAGGEAYNLCSGVARAVKDLLRELILAAHVPVEVREDPQRMRPSDTPLFVGSNTKLREATGWEPRIPLRSSIREIYAAASS